MLKSILKVLCIDDEQVFLDNLTEYLGKSGYDTLKASHASEAHEIIAAEKPDIIIVDIQMPGQDGIGLVSELMYDSANLNGLRSPHVIYLTGMDQPSFQIAARRIGCDDYLVKPVDFTVVAAAIDAVGEKICDVRQYKNA